MIPATLSIMPSKALTPVCPSQGGGSWEGLDDGLFPMPDQQRRHDFPGTDWAAVRESRASPGDFTSETLELAFISSVTLSR